MEYNNIYNWLVYYQQNLSISNVYVCGIWGLQNEAWAIVTYNTMRAEGVTFLIYEDTTQQLRHKLYYCHTFVHTATDPRGPSSW